MTTVHVYGLAVADVAALIGHVGTIGATTSPSSTSVTTWITEVASVVNAVMRAKGMTPETYTSACTEAADLEVYNAARAHISEMVAARWHVANRGADTSLATGYRIRFEKWLETLVKDPASATGTPRGQAGSTTCTADNLRSSDWSRDTGYR